MSINNLVGTKCIVRTYSAGVFFGKIAAKDGAEVIVEKARRLWSWKAVKGISLSAVAQYGIVHDQSTIPAPVSQVWLEAIEIIPATDAAIKTIEEAPEAQQR